MCQAPVQAHGGRASEAGRAPVLADPSAGCQRQDPGLGTERAAATEAPLPAHQEAPTSMGRQTGVEVSPQRTSRHVALVGVLLS